MGYLSVIWYNEKQHHILKRVTIVPEIKYSSSGISIILILADIQRKLLAQVHTVNCWITMSKHQNPCYFRIQANFPIASTMVLGKEMDITKQIIIDFLFSLLLTLET